MQVEALITDATSLGSPRVCIAALAGDRAIRLHSPTPNEGWVDTIGGLMPGDVVSVDWTPSQVTRPPHVEDGSWNMGACANIRRLSEDQLIGRLRTRAFDSVEEAYGSPWIRGKNGNCAFRPGSGSSSLASIRASSVAVHVSFGKVRVAFADTCEEWANVPLQDLAVKRHLRDCTACRMRAQHHLRAEFQGGPALLRVGLAREWPVGNYPPACWMQVNHVFLVPSKRKHFV